MCGLAGFVGTRSVEPARVAECLGTLAHRGPDAAGCRAWATTAGRHVQFVHTRLSIIDLDARANQPFTLGPRTMIYNGEIYNYLEVRAALAAEGVVFTTESDTEVLLRAVDHWGWAALDRPRVARYR